MKKKAEALLSPLAWTALVKFKGSTGIKPPWEIARGRRKISLWAQSCVLRQTLGRGRDKSPLSQPCSLSSSTPQCICVLAATGCKLNEYLPYTDLYQVKNHHNLDLICLCNKWFVYTELDALLQLLEISLNHKTLVSPCLGKAETASLPQPSLY